MKFYPLGTRLDSAVIGLDLALFDVSFEVPIGAVLLVTSFMFVIGIFNRVRINPGFNFEPRYYLGLFKILGFFGNSL